MTASSIKRFVILYLLCGSLCAADQSNPAPADRNLLEITFAADDKPPTQDFHAVLTFYISGHKRGLWRHIYGWAHWGDDAADPEAQKKAAECTTLLKSLEQPKELPDNPNQIVLVKYVDGDKTIIKRFPFNSVPSEIYQVLMVITDSRDEQFTGRLRFR